MRKLKSVPPASPALLAPQSGASELCESKQGASEKIIGLPGI